MLTEWRAALLDLQDRETGRQWRVTGGNLSWSIFQSVAGYGSIDATEELADLVDPDQVRIGISRVITDDAGGKTVEPWGIWLPVIPGYDIDLGQGLARASVELLDKTELLNRQCGVWGSASTSTPVTSQVRAICAQVGETLTAIVDSPATLTTPIVWEPEETWLEIVNRLLRAIGYGSLEAGPTGRLGSAPYVDPDRRPLAATYGDQPGDLELRRVVPREAPIYDVPNVVTVIVPATDTTPAISATARNDAPESPLSTVHRGDRPLVEQVEAASQEIAQQIADRRLVEVTQVTDRISITHPPDGTHLNDRVTIRPLGATGTVVSREVRLDLGAVVQDVVRRIWTGGSSWR